MSKPEGLTLGNLSSAMVFLYGALSLTGIAASAGVEWAEELRGKVPDEQVGVQKTINGLTFGFAAIVSLIVLTNSKRVIYRRSE
jgi:hypothetical protein